MPATLTGMKTQRTPTESHREQAERAVRRYLRTPAAAVRLSAAPQTLERWRVEGSGPPFVRLSAKLVVYDVVDLDAWCESRKVSSTSEVGR
jgi:hypothetical protein